MNEKVLITNKTALQQKYGSGFGKIQDGRQASDRRRQRRVDSNTRLIAVDDPQDMQGVNGKPGHRLSQVSRQNKNAVDAIY